MIPKMIESAGSIMKEKDGRMKTKWDYERLANAIDALWPIFGAAGVTEESRQAYRAASEAIFAEAGWTWEEYDIHVGQILDARWAAEDKKEEETHLQF